MFFYSLTTIATAALLLPSVSLAHQCSKYSLPSQDEIRAAEKVPTGNPAKCLSGTKFFPQRVDHSSSDTSPNSTFLQQYEIHDQHFTPGGPIIYWQNPEQTYGCLNNTSGPAWADELGGMAISLEQRYYGLSTPPGLNYTENTNWTNADMKYLTLENSLLDAVTFVEWIRCNYPGAKDSKVIVFGGSYPGFLTINFRVKYPDVFYGGLASSSVTRGLDVNIFSKYTFAWGNWASQVTSEISALAASRIKQAFVDIREMVKTGNVSGLQEALHLCTPVKSAEQASIIPFGLFGLFTENIQNNRPSFGSPGSLTIETALNSSDSLEILGTITKAFILWNGYPSNCFPYEDQPRTLFSWIQCTYLPYSSPYSTEDSIFGAFLPDYSHPLSLDPTCLSGWNMTSNPGGPDYQRRIRVDQETIDTTERLILSENTWDPVMSIGPDNIFPPFGTNGSRMYFISYTSHIEDILVDMPTDGVWLRNARKFYLETFKEWLGRV
ncbi:hypothetical protein NA57DRAFT_75640 [Rhizodiscina lignyota]|uniref:Serine carboxypeptidase n=1 Tax=Rhizodiscina lignyota TaxID=1504668 RepID=A0A9P4IJ02_9PEZI|nr:hypothetical protein NA57DRAFT_75640 [Rhizodiscina lignyota]